jgi:hypothetical protein
MMRPTRAIAPLLLAATLAACGGGAGDDKATGDSSDATEAAAATPTCPVQATEVVDATGFELAEDIRVDGYEGDVFCVFDAVDGLSNVSITMWRDPEGELVDELSDVPGAEHVELTFADEGVWTPTLTTLYARTGEQVATVAINDVGQVVGDPLAAASAIAEIALG